MDDLRSVWKSPYCYVFQRTVVVTVDPLLSGVSSWWLDSLIQTYTRGLVVVVLLLKTKSEQLNGITSLDNLHDLRSTSLF